MRMLDLHKIPGNPVNDGIDIVVIDPQGPGGANHLYQVQPHDGPMCTINFQRGGVLANGVNGVTQEALLAVIIDRLVAFQAGDFSCRENALALTKCQEALMWLHKRTTDRVARGVEGKELK